MMPGVNFKIVKNRDCGGYVQDCGGYVFFKCIFPRCVYSKCIFAKCTRLACLLSFASLFVHEIAPDKMFRRICDMEMNLSISSGPPQKY